MPIPPKFIHPLRTVRAAMGKKSQAALASLVGVSAVTIKKIEQGDLEMSMSLSMRIMAATGANPLSVRDKNGTPKDIWGDPYDADSFLAYLRSNVGKASGTDFEDEKYYQDTLFRMSCQLEWIVQAAAQRRRLPAIEFAWQAWLYQASSDFHLLETFLKLASEIGENDILFEQLKISAAERAKNSPAARSDVALIGHYQHAGAFVTPPPALPSPAAPPSGSPGDASKRKKAAAPSRA